MLRRLQLALLAAATWPSVAGAQELRVLSHDGAGWQTFWSFITAPRRWSAPDSVVINAIHWEADSIPGIAWGALTVAGDGEAWRIRVIVARLDPAEVRLRTVVPPSANRNGPDWTIRRAPSSARVALNAGQFDHRGPWGWLVRDGVERQPPGRGPLAMALALDTLGQPHFVAGEAMAALRASGTVREAFQSWPALLREDGSVPDALRDATKGVRLSHRDARLGIGLQRNGQLLIALTRFEGLGGVLEQVPFGLTTPEMAALMGALGCREAMLLDGGISSQLLVRPVRGKPRVWPGLRRVPLGLIVEPRR